MEFRLRRPPEPLARWIEHLWFAASAPAEPGAEGDQFPSGGVSILFNLGPPQALIDPDSGTVTWFDGAWVAGERESRLRLAAPLGSALVGAQIRPGMAGAVLGVPLGTLTERIVDLACFWRDAESVRERLALAADADARFLLLEHELARRFAAAAREPRVAGHARLDGVVESAVGALRARGPGASIRDLAGDLGLSGRHLARVFADRVGLGPKALHRVLRFQTVIGAVERLAQPRWTSVAAACGYFDQAHLIRDFRRFTGTTPTAYLERRSADPNFAAAEPIPAA
jgi:AraC-like DNA-binding protein